MPIPNPRRRLASLFPGCCRLWDQLLVDVRRLPICDDPEFPKETAYCGVLRTPPLRLRVARSCGLYEDELVRAVLLVKHERIESLGKWFARQHAPVVQLEKDRMAVDVVIPLPLHAQRARERGFNQVDVFGRPLARLLGLPYKPVLLVRSRPAQRSICFGMKNVGRRHVAHLQCATAVGLTIYESCC